MIGLFYPLSQAIAGLALGMIPPIAIALGALVYGEALPLSAYLGFAVLALGLLILDGRIAPKPRNRTQESA